MRLPAAPQLEPATLTLEAVVRAGHSPGQFRYVVSHGAQGCLAGSYGLYTGRDGGIAFYIFDGESLPRDRGGRARPTSGTARGITSPGSSTARSLRLFVDGRPVGEPIAAPPTIAYELTSDDHYFGTYQGTCALPLKGDVDLDPDVARAAGARRKVGGLSDAALCGPAGRPAHVSSQSPTPCPSATDTDSRADGDASRPALTPIAPGTRFAARNPPD